MPTMAAIRDHSLSVTGILIRAFPPMDSGWFTIITTRDLKAPGPHGKYRLTAELRCVYLIVHECRWFPLTTTSLLVAPIPRDVRRRLALCLSRMVRCSGLC